MKPHLIIAQIGLDCQFRMEVVIFKFPQRCEVIQMLAHGKRAAFDMNVARGSVEKGMDLGTKSKDANWIQTVPGKGWFIALRLSCITSSRMQSQPTMKYSTTHSTRRKPFCVCDCFTPLTESHISPADLRSIRGTYFLRFRRSICVVKAPSFLQVTYVIWSDENAPVT